MPRYLTTLAITTILLITIFTGLSLAADGNLEKDMQRALLQNKAIIKTMQAKLDAQRSISSDLARLQSLAEEIRATHLLLDARFAKREERAGSLGAKAMERHAEIMRQYRLTIEAYLNQIEPLITEQDVTPNVLDNLLDTLDSILPDKKRPIYGTLPYRHLNYPQMMPVDTPAITLAYKGGNPTVTPKDTQSTPEAPITKEIADLAESLNWNPVSIYEWVKNNIETQWYWGCMKGAEETLRQKSGNDADQAALLISLLRAAGYPSRYVRGVIEFFPDIQRAKHLVGIDDENQLAAFFRKAGIPVKTVIAGGRIANLQIEHIWVETRVPYANYRGAVIDEHGKTWLALDTSIKVAGYTYSQSEALPEDFDLTAIRDEYLLDVREDNLLEYLRDMLDAHLEETQAGFAYDDLLQNKTLVPEQMKILPASLQFKQMAITAEYHQLPDELLHQAVFTASDTAQIELFTVTLPAYELSNRMITLTYEPETVEDQEIINSYGGLDNTPSYLVRLRPVLKVDDERKAVGQDGLPMGDEYVLTIELISPNGNQKIENTHVIGNLSVVALVSQAAVAPQQMPAEDKDAAQLLYEAALDYIDRWNQAEDELAALLHLAVNRPIATLVTIGGVIDVTYLFDVPHDFEWKGLYIDADLRAIEIAGGAGPSGGIFPQKIFMQLSSLEGSVSESRVLEENFQVESISTAKLFGLANTDGIPLLTIDAENIEDILPTLAVAENIKEDISHAVNQNFTVRIPQSEIAYEDWVGIGYLKENPQTGEAGWMLSGMVAGGMTVWGLDRWSDYYHARLVNPYAQPSNEDPLSAQSIQKITKTDRQKGTAGEPLANPLQVIVRDDQNRSVVDTPVTFTVKAGGGQFTNQQNTITVNTDFNGIAAAELILGRKTSDNPTMWWESGYTYSQQVGENIVDAALSSGTTITTPFVAYGMPGDPVGIIKLHGDNEHGDVLTWLGFIKVSVEDRYGNSIANVAVIFSMQPAIERSSCSNPNQDSRPGLVISQDDACIYNFPEYGQCAGAKTSQEVITDFKGALVYVMTGGTPDADYPISAGTQDLSTTFTVHTAPFGNCSGTEVPQNSFSMSYTFASDSCGNNINAAQPGAGIPLSSKMSYLREGEAEIEVTLDCSDGSLSCTKIIGNRRYYRDTAFTSAAMSFGGVEGTAEADGIFSAPYEVKPGINDIPITGIATIGYRKSIVNCSGCSIVDDGLTQSGSVSMRVYGVEIQTEPQFLVPVNETGDVTEDYTLSYTIAPSEYKAGSAYIIIFKNDEPVAYIPAETQGIGTGIISRGTGFDLDAEIRYDVQIVLNMGSGVEIKTAKIPLYLAPITIAKEDPEFLNVQLRWNDYYPPLGDKTIVVKADVLGEGSLDGRVLKAEVIYPLEGSRLGIDSENKDLKAVESTITNDKATFQLSGRGLAPRMVIDGTETGVDEISIKFTLLSEGDNLEPEAVIYGSWNVKNNSNTTLAEVLSGEAVFVVDVDSNGNVITAENHKGQTTGNTDDKREVDYVLKMINHIIPPLRTPVVKSNQQNTLPNNGLYGGMTEKTVKAITEGGGPHAISGSINITLTDKIKLSHHDLDEDENVLPATFSKLVKDYTGLDLPDVGKVIDKEILVGSNHIKDYSNQNLNPMEDPDIGILELYEQDDWDGDLISNYVEVENEIDPLVKNEEYTTPANSENEFLSVERGGLGNRWKVKNVRYDTRQGILMNGLRIANVGKGYYYFRSADPADDYDNYGALRAINSIEHIAKQWEETYPDLYPLKKDIFVHGGAPDPDGFRNNKDLDDNDDNDDNKNDIPDNDSRTEVRLGIGDISLENGGPFYRLLDAQGNFDETEWDHSTHQNGLSIDIRYPRNDNTEGRVNFHDDRTDDLFSRELTKKLIEILIDLGAVRIYIDQETKIPQTSIVEYKQGHHHHLHIDFPIVNVPTGEMTLTTENGITSIPADENSTIKITVEAKDTYGFPLVSVNVKTTHGKIINGDYETKDENIGVDQNGKISFVLKSGTQAVDEAIVTVKSIPSAIQATLTIKFTNP